MAAQSLTEILSLGSQPKHAEGQAINVRTSWTLLNGVSHLKAGFNPITQHARKISGRWWCSCKLLKLDNRHRRVVSLKPRPLYPQGKSHWWATHWLRDWVGPGKVWMLWRRQLHCPCKDSNPRISSHLKHGLITILTELSLPSGSCI